MTTRTKTTDTTAAPEIDANPLIEIIESLPTLSREEAVDRHVDRSASSGLWKDELLKTQHVAKKYRPRALDIPGFGEQYTGGEDGTVPCGAQLPHICPECGKPHEVGSTCYRSVCPRCAPAWVCRRAPKIVQNVMAAARMKEGAQYKHHVAVSPPKELLVDIEATEEENPEEAIISMLQDFMREIDMDGIVVYHPWRGEKTEDGETDDIGEWKKRLFSGRDWQGDVREELDHQPHFHLIGACEWFPGGDVTRTIWERTGWIFDRITSRNGSPVSLGNMKNVARATTYTLSHAAIDTDGDRNTYVHGKVGSAYHNNDGRMLEEARDAVHFVAPDTLGIDRWGISCGGKRPLEEVEDTTSTSEGDGDGDAEGDSDGDDTDAMTTCGSTLDCINHADYIEDEEWQRRARYADEAVEKKREWDRIGGFEAYMQLKNGEPPP